MAVEMMYGVVRNGDSLAHYGRSKRDGAKKGSGRYPLGSGKDPRAPLTDEQKAEIIRTGNARAASERMTEFTNEELQAVKTRFTLQKEVSLLDPVKQRNVWDFLDDATKKATKIAGAAEGGIKVYNDAARVLNSLAKTNLPVIKDVKDFIPDEKKAAEVRKALAEAGKAELELEKMRKENAESDKAKKQEKDKKADKDKTEDKGKKADKKKEEEESKPPEKLESEKVEAEVVYDPSWSWNTTQRLISDHRNDNVDDFVSQREIHVSGLLGSGESQTVDDWLKRNKKD